MSPPAEVRPSLTEQREYWKAALEGPLPVLKVPSASVTPPVPSYFRGTSTHVIRRDLVDALGALGSEAHFLHFLAALKAVLFRYTRQQDILVASLSVDSRGESGSYVNPVLVRSTVAGDTSFEDLREQLAENVRGASRHRDLPFESIEAGRAEPPVQIMLVCLGVQGLSEEPVRKDHLATLGSWTVECDLVIVADTMSSEPTIVLDFDADRFTHADASRVAGHLETLLCSALAHPVEKISRLPLLAPDELRQILENAKGAGAIRTPAGKCLHRSFAEQAARRPEAVAVSFDGASLTYGELNRRADRVARRLINRGLRVGDRVGLYADRSADMVIAILAILKAGCAYVPLDPNYPPARVAFMLADAGVVLVLAQPALAARLSEGSPEIVLLDAEIQERRDAGEGPVDTSVTTDDLAYVIYTSGSTGLPKGVEIAHRSVVHLFEATQLLLTFGEADVWPLFHSYSFDFSVWELWGPLLHGGRLVIVPQWMVNSPDDFAQLVWREGITVLSLTPTALGQWSSAATKVPASGQLRVLVCGGDSLPPGLADSLLERQLPLWNFYGPTEATVWATAHAVGRDDIDRGNVAIGRPFGQGSVHVVDEHFQLVPAGVPGEICIGGSGLARGYFNRPDLTEGRFVGDVFSGNGRLYRTGDLGRYRPDGVLEHLGRMDSQVKLRGFRIELGEVETALGRHPAVRQTVAALRPRVSGQPKLAAYVVLEPGRKLPTQEVRAFLGSFLPEYMIPSIVAFVESLPVSPNGKIDRGALPPVPEPELQESQTLLPRSPTEEKLAGIWRDVLGLRHIGMTDSFFEIGGDSLLAAMLFVEIRDRVGRALPMATFYQAPTIEKMARLLDEPQIPTSSRILVDIQPDGSRSPLFLVHTPDGGVLPYVPLARCLGRDQPSYGLQARSIDVAGESPVRIEQLAATYVSEIRGFQASGPYRLGGFCFGGLVAFEMARQLLEQGEEVALLAVFDSQAPNTGDPLPDSSNEDGTEFTRYEGILDLRLAARLRQAARAYCPGPSPAGVTLFLPAEQPVDVSKRIYEGWRNLASFVELHSVPGNHVAMMVEPHVRRLADVLTDCLSKSRTEETGK